MSRFSLWLFLMTLVLPAAQAQQPKSDVEYGSQMAKEVEVENQAQEGVPGLFDDLNKAIDSLKKNDFEDSQAAVTQARTEVGAMLQVLGKNPEYQEVTMSLERIDMALQEAGMSLKSRRKPQASAQLNQALKFTKVLAASPVLKLTATKVSLRLANREIAGGNYGSAAAWLERAINSLTAIMENPNINQKEITALKNDIVIAHNQVIVGKMKDKSYMGKLYDRASAATTNAMYQYYDMWTMDPNTPWSWY